MAIDDSKIFELEDRINGFERILKDIRDELKSQNGKIRTEVRTKESELTFTQREKIWNIMENFNFQKVHDVMEQLGWKWVMTKYGIPTIDELKTEAKRLLIEACVERTVVATGGLRAVYEESNPDDNDPYVGLEFIIEECEGFVESDRDCDVLDERDDDDE